MHQSCKKRVNRCAVPSQSTPIIAVVPRGRPLIAVVDDDESIRNALRRLIRAAGFEVETFASGGEFLSSVEGHASDCVVLDLHMPGMSGFELQIRLKQTRSLVPVVVITGDDTPAARNRVLSAGASAILRKPVDDEVLLDAIASAIASAKGS